MKQLSGPPSDATPIVETKYYRWDFDACRLHTHANGRETADLYRAGEGFIPIHPVDLQFDASSIDETHYRYLVEMDDAAKLSDAEVDPMEWVKARICGEPLGEAEPPLPQDSREQR